MQNVWNVITSMAFQVEGDCNFFNIFFGVYLKKIPSSISSLSIASRIIVLNHAIIKYAFNLS
jgi:hypothetical protein